MRILQTRSFARFARKAKLADAGLQDVFRRIDQGKCESDLGGGVVKQRVARRNEGKSGGFLTILVFRSGDRAIFLGGFAKSALANITDDELRDMRLLAKRLLALSQQELDRAVSDGALLEVKGGR